MHGFLFLLGCGLFLVGLFTALSNLKNLARRRRVLAIPTSPISQATGGLVEIKGHVVPGDKGLVEAPVSDRQVVWAHVTVDQEHTSSTSGGGTTTTSENLLDEITSRPFFVDDSSGEMALILPQDANVILGQESVAKSGQFHNASPRFEAFLRSRDLNSKNFFGFNKTL